MRLEQLEYFALTYQTKSYAAAAKQIPMTPQGLSKSMHSLEIELGVPLFVVSENGELEPTPYADDVLAFAQRYDTSYTSLKESIKRRLDAERGQVEVGICLGILGYLGPDFIEGFSAAYPNITLRYYEVSDVVCDERLRRGDYNLALTIAPYETDFLTKELYSTPVFYWLNANDPLSRKDSLVTEDFEGRDVAMPGSDFKCFSSFAARCEEAGVSSHVTYTSAEIFRLYEFARQGLGLSFSAEHLTEMQIFRDNPEVVALPLEGAYWSFGISRLPFRPLSWAEQAFYDYCLTGVPAFSAVGQSAN